MELILWRHAEAVDAGPNEDDLSRALTRKGRKQAARMGQWLDANLPHACKILVSPARRAIETAEALERKFQIVADLAPDSDPMRLLRAANWPDSKSPVVIVGHQPTLGQLASLLITGSSQDWTIRKGNIWWLCQRDREDGPGNFLRAIMAPDLTLLRK